MSKLNGILTLLQSPPYPESLPHISPPFTSCKREREKQIDLPIHRIILPTTSQHLLSIELPHIPLQITRSQLELRLCLTSCTSPISDPVERQNFPFHGAFSVILTFLLIAARSFLA